MVVFSVLHRFARKSHILHCFHIFRGMLNWCIRNKIVRHQIYNFNFHIICRCDSIWNGGIIQLKTSIDLVWTIQSIFVSFELSKRKKKICMKQAIVFCASKYLCAQFFFVYFHFCLAESIFVYCCFKRFQVHIRVVKSAQYAINCYECLFEGLYRSIFGI